MPVPLPDRPSRRPESPWLEPDGGGRSVGGVLHELLTPELHPPAERAPASTEVIRDGALVEARLRALAARESATLLRVGDTVLHGNAVAWFSDGPCPLQLEFPEAPPDAPFSLELLGYNSVYRFQVERAQRIGSRISVPLPPDLLRVQHRRYRRAPAPAGYALTFQHPARPDLQVRRALVDLSRHGCRVRVRPDQDLVRVGQVLPEVKLQTSAGLVLTFDAEIRIIFPADGGAEASMGLRLTPRTPTDAARWEQTVGNLLNPMTQLGGTWSEDTWELFDESGYFSLSGKSGARFTPLKSAFASVIRKLDAAPQVGCQVAWPSERGIEASLSMLKIYEHTWFGYQMAKLPGDPPDGTSGRQVLRDIHLRAYEHAQADPTIRWTMGLVQATARWSKLVHHDLPARYVDTGLACIQGFHALEIEIPARPPDRLATAGITSATPAETAEFLESVGRSRPWAYREALDLVPERFELATLRTSWAAAGFRRDRELLAARVDGRMVAVALVESADPGLHLFSLLDVVRLYAIVPGGEARFGLLLDAAATWYRLRGRTTFCCLLEEGSPSCADHLSPTDLGKGSLTVLANELLPSFFEHVSEVTAPRLPRS